MTTYLIEAYSANGDIAELVDRARTTAGTMSSEGHAIRYLHSVLLRGDETCFHLVEAGSPDTVSELARRAELGYERVVEAEEWQNGREDAGAGPAKCSHEEGGTK